MECIIAKIFGSEAQKEAAIELFMKTHGGRAFLHGHMFGDNVHEYLAPCIYEGEGEMLGMAFFKSLVKQHGVQFFEPIGKALRRPASRKPNLMNPAHAWALQGPLLPYARWLVGQKLRRPAGAALAADARAAARRTPSLPPTGLQRLPLEISGTMSKHQLALADRQCRMSELSQRVQDVVVDALHQPVRRPGRATRSSAQAADCLCQDLTRKLTGHAGRRTATSAPSPSWARRSPTAASSRSPACIPTRF